MQKIKLFVQSFIPAFFFFSLMIMAAVLWVSPVSRTQETPAQSYLSLPSDNDTLSILAVHAEKKTLYSISLISIQAQRGQILIHSFPVDTVINGKKLSELWEQKSDLLSAVLSSYSGYEIQRQICVDDGQFLSLVEYFGSVSAVLEEPLRYTQSGLSITLEPGPQRLNGLQCLYYLQAAPTNFLRARRCEELLKNAVNEHWSLLASEQAQDIFLTLLDFCDTDLTVSDFDRFGAAFSFMARVVENPAVIQESSAS